MDFYFNADEIFKIAEQIEENGIVYYKKASEIVSGSSYKKLFTHLSGMETDHRNTFSSMRAGLTEKEKQPSVFDPMDESAEYLKALAGLEIFYGKQPDTNSAEKILTDAIDIEKDSIVFYVGMKDLVSERMGKDKIDKIISEEKKHLQLLANELTALRKS